jgi:hypothetical protein
VNKSNHLSARELRLLSAYLDGELSTISARRVERLIKANPNASAVLDQLRGIKEILKLLPERKAPRDFTITAHDIKQVRLPSIVGVLRYASALSVFLLCALLAFDFLSPFRQERVAVEFSQSVPEPMAAEKGDLGMEEEAPIINWHPAGREGYGIGGGGGGEGVVEEQNEILLPDAVLAPGEEFTDGESAITSQEELPEVVEAPQAYESPDKGSEEEEEVEPETREDMSGPILGIRPEEEQGTVEMEEIFTDQLTPAPQEFPFGLIEIILACISILTIVLSILIKRKRHI